MTKNREMTLVGRNAERFKALGNPIRLFILRLVVKGHESGTPAGEIQDQVGIPASTLSHHLLCLSEAELVQVERDGSFLRYRANFDVLSALTDYLWEDCCSGGTLDGRPGESGASCCRRKANPSSRK